MSEVTVLLNCYRRYWAFDEQYDSLLNQSVAPKEILVWQNYYPDTFDKFNQNIFSKTKTAICNQNLGVWARFAYALNAKTKYVCIFDDDTIPGKRWLENCLETIKQVDGLLGVRGLIYRNQHTTDGQFDVSPWCFTTEQTTQVDIVGHGWFFEREWLQAYWRELPPPQFFSAGEDIHFSYTIQKFLNKNTYVPAQPKNTPELWGSLKAREYGCGAEAASLYCCTEIQQYLGHVVSKGFKTINYI
jgi:hypothetical protein